MNVHTHCIYNLGTTLMSRINVPICLSILRVFIPNFFVFHLNKDFAYVVKFITQYTYSCQYVYQGHKSTYFVLQQLFRKHSEIKEFLTVEFKHDCFHLLAPLRYNA